MQFLIKVTLFITSININYSHTSFQENFYSPRSTTEYLDDISSAIFKQAVYLDDIYSSAIFNHSMRHQDGGDARQAFIFYSLAPNMEITSFSKQLYYTEIP